MTKKKIREFDKVGSTPKTHPTNAMNMAVAATPGNAAPNHVVTATSGNASQAVFTDVDPETGIETPNKITTVNTPGATTTMNSTVDPRTGLGTPNKVTTMANPSGAGEPQEKSNVVIQQAPKTGVHQETKQTRVNAKKLAEDLTYPCSVFLPIPFADILETLELPTRLVGGGVVAKIHNKTRMGRLIKELKQMGGERAFIVLNGIMESSK